MSKNRYDRKEYKYFVFNTKTKKIISGFEYHSDALDLVKEYDNPKLKVYTRTFLKRTINPSDNNNWSNEVSGVKPYKQQKEVVLYGNFRKDINIPEIKIRYNRGKDFGKIKNSNDVYQLLLKIYGRNINLQEHFIMLLCDNSLNITGYYKHTIGTPTSTIIDIPMLIGIATKSLARSVIISHNHPSGKLNPSMLDEQLTKGIKKAFDLVNVKIHDHIIVTPKDGYYSFSDNSNSNLEGFGKNDYKKENDSLEKELRQEVFNNLQKVNKNKMLTPKIYDLIQSKNGYEWVERRIINMVINDNITISSCIPHIESEL